jgi:hypothetical protein
MRNMVLRALVVLTAVSLTPFVAGAAQGRGPADKCKDKAHPANRGAVQSAQAPGQAKKVCDTPVPPPPPPPPPPPSGDAQSVIQGAVFDDANASFVRDAGEPGLSGWSVTLSGPVSAAASTGADGSYSFTGLPAGTYVVCVAPQIGWWQTLPMEGAMCNGSGMIGYILSIGAGQTVTLLGNDFGNALIQ